MLPLIGALIFLAAPYDLTAGVELDEKGAQKKHFVKFEAHTLLKHGVLRRYLRAWARKLLLWSGRDFDNIWIVDAFAGVGEDEHGHPGSPLICAQIALEVERDLGSRGRAGRVRVLAIEKEKEFYDRLVTRMRPYASGPDPTL